MNAADSCLQICHFCATYFNIQMNKHVTNLMQNIVMTVAVMRSVGSDVTSVGSGSTTTVEGLQDTRSHTRREHMDQAVLALSTFELYNTPYIH